MWIKNKLRNAKGGNGNNNNKLTSGHNKINYSRLV